MIMTGLQEFNMKVKITNITKTSNIMKRISKTETIKTAKS